MNVLYLKLLLKSVEIAFEQCGWLVQVPQLKFASLVLDGPHAQPHLLSRLYWMLHKKLSVMRRSAKLNPSVTKVGHFTRYPNLTSYIGHVKRPLQKGKSLRDNLIHKFQYLFQKNNILGENIFAQTTASKTASVENFSHYCQIDNTPRE